VSIRQAGHHQSALDLPGGFGPMGGSAGSGVTQSSFGSSVKEV
jgi:hypothetical protein